MLRLLPQPAAEVSVEQACSGDRPRWPERPWVELSMVASVDGSSVVDTTSGALSSEADRAMFLTLRSMADVIVVGAGTVRAEGYGPPRRAGQRLGVVTNRVDLDLTTPLFTSGAGFLIVPETAPPQPVDTVRAGRDRVDLAAAMTQLDAGFVQVEGGPSLNAAFAEADLLDEVNLTLSPQLAGGGGPRIVAGAAPVTRRLALRQIVEADGFLFTRWVRVAPTPEPTSPGLAAPTA